VSDYLFTWLLPADAIFPPVPETRLPFLPVIFATVIGGGGPTPTPSDGQLDFSNADQSGLLALIMEDF
jgi:hypothetical protein